MPHLIVCTSSRDHDFQFRDFVEIVLTHTFTAHCSSSGLADNIYKTIASRQFIHIVKARLGVELDMSMACKVGDLNGKLEYLLFILSLFWQMAWVMMVTFHMTTLLQHQYYNN